MDKEPQVDLPVESTSSQVAPTQYVTVKKTSAITLIACFCFGTCITLGAVIGGFVFGERYGRENAQFDNPSLRKHYTGQCYDRLEKSVVDEVRRELRKVEEAALAPQQLDEILRSVKMIEFRLGQTFQSPSKVSKGPASKTAREF